VYESPVRSKQHAASKNVG